MPRFAFAVLCFGVARSLFAQQATLSEKVEVRLIEIDAVVTDRRGNAVTGLGPDDFELLENGRPQPITNFTEVREGAEVTARSSEAQPGVDASLPQRQPRTIVVLVDALPLRGRARRALFVDLGALVEKTMGEGDRGQVLAWHDRTGMRSLTPLTRSRAEVLTALAHAEARLHADPPDVTLQADAEWFREMGAVVEKDDTRFDGETHVAASAQQAALQELALMRRKTAALQRLMPAIAEPAHRNVMIYVSGAFPMNAGAKTFAGLRARTAPGEQADYGTGAMLEAVVRTANSHGVIVYALRPDVSAGMSRIRTTMHTDFELGLDSDSPGDTPFTPHLTDMALEQTLLQNDAQALGLLTTATGGTLAVGSSAIRDAVDRIARDLSSYYTLAYRVTADGSDRERRIEVRARNRQHAVRTRKTILDRSDASRARDLLVARLFEIGGEGQIEFDIEAGAAREGVVPIELTIPVDQLRFDAEGEELVARFSILLVAGRDIGQISRLVDDTKRVALPKDKRPAGVLRYRFDLNTGRTEAANVSIAVFDEKSGLAGRESIEIAAGEIRGDAVSSGAIADDAWRDALRRANEERKPVLVFFRPKRCRACARFESETLAHPAIGRRLSEVVLVTLSSTAGQLARVWKTREAGFGVFDRRGTFRLSFDGVPDLATFGIILDDIADVAPHLERAVAAAEDGQPHESEFHSAMALMALGRRADARAALSRAIDGGNEETRRYAFLARALLDGQEGRAASALAELDTIIAHARTPELAGEAWLAIGLIHRLSGEAEEATQAFAKARDLVGLDSRIAAISDEALAALESAADGSGPVRIVPPGVQVLSGRVPVTTIVTSAEIEAVSFLLDGVEVSRVRRPPFAATIDFGRVPEERTLAAVAFDGLGNEAGRDELTVNAGGERFWFRIAEPAGGAVSGRVAVRMNLRAPAGQTVQRVSISWNDELRTVVSGPPWEATVTIPGEIGVLRGVAYLSDGRSAEDAVLLNASGHTERAAVQLVELPVTVGDPQASLEAAMLVVSEGGRRRAAESIQSPSDSPLTLGFVMDSSASMQDALANVQEAAIGFLERVLTERDRGFLVSFSTRARLVQPPTSDRERLRGKIMSLRARGSTALYDAIAVGLLQLQGVKGRRALVVFTDGADLTSRYGALDVAALAKRTHVPIHIIATTPNRSTSLAPAGPRPDELRWGGLYRTLAAMSESTGGRAYRLDRLEDLPQVYQRIGDALRAQFLVFLRTDPGRHENDWRSIEIVARGLTLFAPEGYYAPW